MEPAGHDERDAVGPGGPAEAATHYTGVVPEPKRSSSQVGQYLSLGLLLPVSTFVGYAIGYLLDRLFGTRFLKIPFLILGTVAGFVQLYRELSRDANDGGS